MRFASSSFWVGVLDATPSAGTSILAIQVLKRIGSKEAREVLEMLAKDSPSLRERNGAKAAIARLERRASDSR